MTSRFATTSRPLTLGCGVLLACALARVSAADEAAQSPAVLWVYVSVGGEERIACYALDTQSGALTFRENIAVEGTPGALGLSRDGRFVYAALRSTKRIGTLKLDRGTGTLTAVESIEAVDNPVYVASDRAGQFLLTAYYAGGKAAVYPLQSDGRVGPSPASVVTTQKNPHSILAGPSGRRVYVPNTGSDVILQYDYDAQTGQLVPAGVPEVATERGAGPRHLFFHPTLPILYVVNEKNSTVSVYGIEETGDLAHVQSLSTLPDYDGKNTCADIEATPDGRFVYCSNRGHDSLAGFEVDESTGRLTAIGHFSTEKTPRSFNIDPAGNFIVAAGQGSGKLVVYRIDRRSGRLDALKTYEVGPSPAWVLIVAPGS